MPTVHIRLGAAIASAQLIATAAAAQTPPSAPAIATPDLNARRMALVGEWAGQLEYRDYQSDRWFPLPVKVRVLDGGDGVTLIRQADFDDGPARGNVRITTTSMLGPDGITEYNGTFRAGRPAELSSARLTLRPPSEGASSAARWTMVAEQVGKDDDRPARIRETSTRDGDTLVTLKEIDFTDDGAETWLIRNRTTLRRLER